MRLSVIPDDPGYNPAAFGTKVFLDGAELKLCVTADEEKGAVLVYKVDADGHPMLTPDRQEIEQEWRFGSVRLELSPAMNRWLTVR